MNISIFYDSYAWLDCDTELRNFIYGNIPVHLNGSDYDRELQMLLHTDEFREMFVHLGTFEMALVYLFAVVFLIAIGGNLLVCFAVFRNEHMQTVTNYYIVNLALSDIFMIILCMPATVCEDLLTSWYFGNLGCKLIPYAQYVSTSVSIFTLTAIAADRYLAICCPLKFHIRSSRTLCIIALIWSVSFILPSPLIKEHVYVPNTFFDLFENPAWLSTCSESLWTNEFLGKVYHICLILIMYVIPLCIISVAYAMVCMRLWSAIPTEEARSQKTTTRSTKSVNSDSKGLSTKSTKSTKSSTEHQKESRRKVARMLIVLVLIFAVCYFPMHALNFNRFVMGRDNVCEETSLMKYIFILSHFLIYANTAANPIIYNFLSAKFRREFQAALCPFVQGKQRTRGYSRATMNSRTRRTISRESRPSSNTGVLSTECMRMSNL